MTFIYSGIGKGLPNPQTSTPTSGQTVVMIGGNGDAGILLTPATDLAALTVTLPNIPVGCTAFITSTRNITTLTVNGATIANNIDTIMAMDTVSFYKVSPTMFSRVTSA